MEMGNGQNSGERPALCHGTDRQTLMQTLDDDKDADACFVREGSHTLGDYLNQTCKGVQIGY